ncbi:MAG TPA: CinA family nicotinamide mononucleotide deamidase-related protein, partial [Pyrinomonadaceae bacterium]|nr:CinA family nicotinamide mononucleotide deamidase-related protein [Pyrinomonadaceae bacterium]
GGLGPTEDDITRESLANALGRPLVYKPELEDEIRSRFSQYGRQMPEINKRQAWIPEGAESMKNPNGSAPGILIETGESLIAAFPGPPRELKPMFADFLSPRLEKFRRGEIFRRCLRVTGMGESAVDEKIAGIYQRYSDVSVTILFNRVDIEIHLSTQITNGAAILSELSEEIKNALGVAVYSLDGRTMEEVIGGLLTERNETLSVAESCTGGLVGMRLTSIAGSSRYFIGGVVAYSNEIKNSQLGVKQDTLAKYGAVSEQAALEMAEGVLSRFGTDHAISVTGIAGPDGGTSEKPVGTVFIAYAGKYPKSVKHLKVPGDRELIRWRSSQAVLELLRRQIIKQ